MANQFLSVEIDEKTLDEVKFMLDTVKNGADTAIRRAANDTAVTARSRVVDTVYSRVNLKKARIRKNTSVLKAKFGSLTAKVVIFTKPIPLVEFPYITSFVGTSVSVRKSRPAELYRHRFVAKMPSGHVGIFERRQGIFGGAVHFGKKISFSKPVGRLPIDEQAGPGIGNIFHHNDEDVVFGDMMELFQKRVLDRAVYLLSQAK